MSKYRCIECDAEFDEPISWQEGRGEFWGDPCWETVWGCPICKGEFMTEEEYKRDILGESDNDDEEESEETEK